MARKKAGHRSWKREQLAKASSGDVMSSEKRSSLMARVRTRDTSPELTLSTALRRQGLRFRKHPSALPGRPDIVFVGARLAVFVDGDFWHGWRFPQWKHKLSEFWQRKIEQNRLRDQRNFRRLRRAGWLVVRIWEHQIEADVERCARLVAAQLRRASERSDATMRVRSRKGPVARS